MIPRNLLLVLSLMTSSAMSRDVRSHFDEDQIEEDSNLRAINFCTGPIPTCSPTQISSTSVPVTGFCNNVQNPILGNKDQPYRRLLPACDREIITTRNTLLVSSGRDGGRSGGGSSGFGPGESNKVGTFNANAAGNVQCNTGNLLPNARLVSRTIHTDQNNPGKVNQFFPMFGQFVCHDFILTESLKPNPANCCITPGISDFTNCLPIIVPDGDNFFTTGQCLDFKRSSVYCNQTGSVRRHVNQLSAFVDAENIYGVDQKTADAIRAGIGGKLKETNPGHLLPKLSLTGALKYTAGEGRATENPALATVHTIFMREHNRVAGEIGILNSALTDDQIYNIARRIVIGEVQNIVFGEFLSILIGTSSLFPASKVSTTYNPNIDPSVSNEFSASAYRFGHTLVNGQFRQNDPLTGSLLGSYLLRISNNNEGIYEANPDLGMTSIAKGMTLQAAQAFDNFVTSELTNFLYASSSNNFAFGSDLAARNIQRGRDNGLNGWAFYRKACGGSVPSTWNSRPKDITSDNWNKLRSLYTSIQDIDLFTGSLAESPLDGAVLGLTSACIVAEQFKRSIAGDRYFFTHGSNVGAKFSSVQIAALKKVRMFDILCLNTNISAMQPKAFLVAALNGNPLVSCQNAVGIDVSLFM